jgi:hypothetical protein
MSITLTFHGHRPVELVKVDVLPPQIGARVDIAIASNTTIARQGLLRVKALADCRVYFGEAGSTVTEGEKWQLGDTEVRWVEAGTVIKVGAF